MAPSLFSPARPEFEAFAMWEGNDGQKRHFVAARNIEEALSVFQSHGIAVIPGWIKQVRDPYGDDFIHLPGPCSFFMRTMQGLFEPPPCLLSIPKISPAPVIYSLDK